jgi:uncharacterized protein with NAD-binding domain and iron-sulfur cluster
VVDTVPGPAPRPKGEFWVPGFVWRAEETFRRHRVAVFGAGIGGLTAAQELAERGFKVHVFDKHGESQAGGLAASQWHVSKRIPDAYKELYESRAAARAAVPPGSPVDDCATAVSEAMPRKLPTEFVLPAEHGFRFFPSFYTHVIDTMRRIPLWERPTLYLPKLKEFADKGRDQVFFDAVATNFTAAKALVDQCSANNGQGDLPKAIKDLQGAQGGMLKALHAIQCLLDFRGQVDFFRPPFVVADNLVATNKTALVFDDGRVLEYDRRLPRSQMGAFAATFLLELVGLGHEVRDMAILFSRMFQFLTSCRERRLAEYEKMTFWDFMQADRLSPILQGQLERFTRILLAMDARRGEARTLLNVLVRMLLDQGSQGSSTDRVLNGPTSERWIVPWVRHLQQSLDVTFHWCTELTSFQAEDGRIVDAYVRKANEDPATLTEFLRQHGFAEDVGVPKFRDGQEWNYFVADLPVSAMWQVLQNSDGLLDADEAETAALPPRSFPAENPDPPLRAIGHLVGPDCNPLMSGMQFYLSDPIDLGVPGHMNFVDSKWALTAIVQSQFWGPDFVSRYGSYVVRAVLSVDIAQFDVPGEIVPMTLRELAMAYNARPSQEISDLMAKEVWHQMAKGLRKPWNVRLPEPEEVIVNGVKFPIPLPYLDHHVDWTLCGCSQACDPDRSLPEILDECGYRAEHNPAYFIARPDSWRHRPGPLPAYDDAERGYRVRLRSAPKDLIPRGLLIAGVYAQTFTSLNTMEAANESARHAVNGLLAHHMHWREANRIPGGMNRHETCNIWPLEELEPADFESGKQVDSRLFSLGDPHAFEIQGQDKVVDYFTEICNVQNQPYPPEQLQQKFKEVLWTLTAFGRYDPF